ncbi:hypothetical protein GCM10027290_55840 [Micromonospora sonneratiae]
MTWRKGNRRRRNTERPFVRRVGFETLKEGSGTLLQQVSGALGALTGLGISSWGLPVTASVITGAIFGGVLGVAGKGFIAASVDHFRERRDQQPAQIAATSPTAGRHRIKRSGGRRGKRQSATALPGGQSSLVGQVVAGLGQVIEQVDRATNKLKAVTIEMRESQNAILAVLAGGRPVVVGRTDGRLAGARQHIDDSASLLKKAGEAIAAYRNRF